MSNFEWKKVLCPVDFSPPSLKALEVAVEIGRRFDAELVLFHAYQLPTVPVLEGAILPGPGTFRDVLDTVERDLSAWEAEAKRRGATKVSSVKAMGTPHEEIVRHATECGADVVVMGTHGRTALKHVLLGSVAEKVVRYADCPVLTIRARGRQAAPKQAAE